MLNRQEFICQLAREEKKLGVNISIGDKIKSVYDLDGDFIPNYLDTDADGDGVLDINDQCPLLAGELNLNGCPVDTDGDGWETVAKKR